MDSGFLGKGVGCVGTIRLYTHSNSAAFPCVWNSCWVSGSNIYHFQVEALRLGLTLWGPGSLCRCTGHVSEGGCPLIVSPGKSMTLSRGYS